MPEVLNTMKTADGIEIYENGIAQYLDQYIQERQIEDMYKETLGDMDIDLSGYLTKTGDGSSLTETFAQAATLSNIAIGEKHSTIFGKIAKAIATLIK
ncbi:MAG: hypothetical protein UFG06_06835 [Lachnospiraceae bacterium]|nr:hypothetical protein [Lachnospiraceae bacterium]